MAAGVRVARRGGDGSVLGRLVEFDETICRRCPEGVDVGVTVFFPGLGDDTDDNNHYTYETEDQIQQFLDDLGAKMAAGKPTSSYEHSPCCVQILLRVDLDSDRSMRENGADVAAQLYSVLQGLGSSPAVKSVAFHLFGFSAGGFVAVETASSLSARVPRSAGELAYGRPRPVEWCGRTVQQIPVCMDLVTLATPYENCLLLEGLAELGNLLDNSFFNSCGALDFGSEERPDGVSSYVAIVTGDEDAEAGSDPPGPEVSGWNPEVKDFPGHDHVGSLTAAVNDDTLLPILNPGCGCRE